MGTNYFLVHNRPTVNPPMHIGKSSIGWRFLFQAVDFDWQNTFEGFGKIQTFPQWKRMILETTGDGRAVIMDEYDEIVKADDFFQMVAKKQEEQNEDNFAYADNIDGYRFSHEDFS